MSAINAKTLARFKPLRGSRPWRGSKPYQPRIPLGKPPSGDDLPPAYQAGMENMTSLGWRLGLKKGSFMKKRG